jgi:plastocyanin
MTKLMAPMAALLVVLGSACSSSKSTSTPTTPAATGGNEVAITIVDNSFNPSTITAVNTATLVLTNNGAALHNFTIEGSTVDQDVQPGQTLSLTPPPTPFAPGTYNVFCKYHKALGMTATLTVTAG